jgi:HD-like signal output (HDOD) protein
MFFAAGGEEALNEMERTAFDVVVTDMRMPGMDGATLLERVQARHPDVMRIVLSGDFDVEAGMRAVPVAHQFLMKPCDPEKLRAAIERCSHESNFPPDQATRRAVSAVGSLPSPPKTCVLLLEAINDPNASLHSIAQIIQQDVALAAKVLQLAHSAFFGLPQEGTDVETALTVLGMDVLKQLVLSAEILRQFRPLRPIPGFSLEDFERHSHRTAQIAGHLPTNAVAKNHRAVTALLHDAGKLIFATHLPGDFEKACRMVQAEGCLPYQAEYCVFGTSHAEIGAYLLNLWGLPQVAVEAIGAHHRPKVRGTGPGLDLTATVHVANALAHDSTEQGDVESPLAHLDLHYAGHLGMTAQLPVWRNAARQWTSPGF